MAKKDTSSAPKPSGKRRGKTPAAQPKRVPALKMVAEDSWLEPYEQDLLDRLQRFQQARQQIEKVQGSLRGFAKAYEFFGINRDPENRGWWYREWAPAARALHLIGDFNDWDRSRHPLEKKEGGIWEIFIPDQADARNLQHGDLLKVQVTTEKGVSDRIPAYIRRAVQDPESHDFSGQIWSPEKSFEWTDQDFDLGKLGAPLIYESHTGMATEELREGTYREFADLVLPRIEKLGYNSIQMMAVMEHPYYGSFGYHVSNFFAPSSRFGTPEDLKYLVNEAHKRGIAVIMDIVHSHAVKNHAEGLNDFDGSGAQYFHEGGRGYHEGWDSKLFNYGKWEVQQFLLSNIAYWLEEFHFDGFRFDGVTSMLYFHHGNTSFGHYDKYFRDGVEWDSITYLQLAAALTREIKPEALLIAEDMSGMPGMCRPIEEGGIGFDYRLAMGVPDYWIKLLKHKKDEDWDMHEIWHTLSNRRKGEANIAYAESHDQALVGDKTLAFWLMDKEMYFHMQKDDPHAVIDRGLALHKMLRLISASLAGEGYLNFMGNEFGHPEWIDFPREGNDWSYQYARRQWSLVDNQDLKYQYFNAFDQAMVRLLKEYDIPGSEWAQQLNIDHVNQVMAFERGGLIFFFNFHPTRSIPDYKFGVPELGEYEIVLNSDDEAFGGHARIDNSIGYPTTENSMLRIYSTNRTALVLKKKEG
jgi:1,4-alpha-glucan branching enzyme